MEDESQSRIDPIKGRIQEVLFLATQGLLLTFLLNCQGIILEGRKSSGSYL